MSDATADTLLVLVDAIRDASLDAVEVDFRIGLWLQANNRLAEQDPPPWTSPTRADRLMRRLLPDWRVERLDSMAALIRGPDGEARGTGIDMGRAILAATFKALEQIERAKPDPMAELRAGMQREVAHG